MNYDEKKKLNEYSKILKFIQNGGTNSECSFPGCHNHAINSHIFSRRNIQSAFNEDVMYVSNILVTNSIKKSKKANIFPLFCPYHDNKLFSSIENTNHFNISNLSDSFLHFYRLNAYDMYIKQCFDYLLDNGNKWTKKILKSSPRNYVIDSENKILKDMINLCKTNTLEYFNGNLLSIKQIDLNKINCSPLFFRLIYDNVCQVIATTDNNIIYLMFYFDNVYNKKEFDLYWDTLTESKLSRIIKMMTVASDVSIKSYSLYDRYTFLCYNYRALIYNSNTESFVSYLENLLNLSYMSINQLFNHEKRLNIDSHCGVQTSKLMYLNQVSPNSLNYRRRLS